MTTAEQASPTRGPTDMRCGCCGGPGRAIHEVGVTPGVFSCRGCAFNASRFADEDGGHGPVLRRPRR